MNKLSFGLGNAKLSDAIATFSLPAGWTCKFADKCLSKADKDTGKLKDGPNMEFRCYAASEESIFPSVRRSRWKNFEMLKVQSSIEEMANLIQRSLPFGIGIVRVHPSGDFFSEQYFLAWLNVALNNPMLVVYGYTKCLSYLVKYQKDIPTNFRFTASKGGKLDHLIEKHNMRSAEVVFSTEEARRKGLPIDHDDSNAIYGNSSFLLLLHGKQAKDSEASKALIQLKQQGLGKYNESTKQLRMNKPITMYIHLRKSNLAVTASSSVLNNPM